MVIEQFSKAINDGKPTEALKESALSLLNASESQKPESVAYAAIYLYNFYSDKGIYDKIIIDHLDKVVTRGFSYKKDPDLFLQLSKILARLYFKYGKYRQAGNFILFITENTDEDHWPDWLSNYRTKSRLYIDPEYCFLCPDKILSNIPITDTNDKQRIAVYRDFLQQSCTHYTGKDEQVIVTFVQKVSPFISEHIGLFVDEWDAFSDLLSDMKSTPLDGLDSDLVRRINGILKVDIDRLNRDLDSREEQIVELSDQVEKLKARLSSDSVEMDRLAGPVIPASGAEEVIEYEPRILVLGASSLSDTNICKTIERCFGLSRKSIEIRSDYAKNKNCDISKLKYNSEFDGILLGPIAHSVCGMGDNNSVVQTLSEEGYPPFEVLRSKSGRMKITKTALKDAMAKLLNTIQSNTPVNSCA